MSKLDTILTNLEQYNLGLDPVTDEPFTNEECYAVYPELKQARKEIEDLLREYIGASDVPDWDYEYGMCNTCDFQPIDDTQNCICVFRNKLKDEIKARL